MALGDRASVGASWWGVSTDRLWIGLVVVASTHGLLLLIITCWILRL